MEKASITHQSAPVRLRTDSILEQDRVAVVREVYGETILRASIEPLGDEPVNVDMTLCSLPDVGIATGASSPFRIELAAHAVTSDDLVLLAPLSGGSLMRHRGREQVIAPGQALLMSSAEAGINVNRPGFRFVNLSYSRKALAPLIGDPEFALMRLLHARHGPLRLLLDYVISFQTAGQRPAAGLEALVARHMLDLTALTIGATRDAEHLARGRGLKAARMRAIKADIVENGGHSRLSAADIGVRHGLSERYVRKLFEAEGLSLTEFMLQQRLARAHRMLTDRNLDRMSITDVAYESGFNDLSYFNRSFRRRYDATPSDIRDASLRA